MSSKFGSGQTVSNRRRQVYDTKETRRVTKAVVRKQLEQEVREGRMALKDAPFDVKLTFALELEQKAGRMPPDMTTDQLLLVRERMKTPKIGRVPVPMDYRTEEELQADRKYLGTLWNRGDSFAQEFQSEMSARNMRWQAEKPEYERRLAECDVINNICEAAVNKIHLAKKNPGSVSYVDVEVAQAQVYEIAITGHLKGVSERMLGPQMNTIRNYEYHFRDMQQRGEQVQVPMEYTVLKHYEAARTGHPQDAPLPVNEAWLSAQVKARAEAQVARAKQRADAMAAQKPAQPQRVAPDGPQTAPSGLDAQNIQRSQPVYRGESGVPIDATHPNRQRIVPASRSTDDMQVKAAEPASQDMQGGYPDY